VSVVQKEQNSSLIWTLHISTSLYKRARKNLWNRIPRLRILGVYSLVPWNNLSATLESSMSLSRDWVCVLDLLIRCWHRLMVAEDYCVKNTSMDAAKKGFEVYVVEDCTRGVEEASVAQAREELKAAGVNYIHSTQIEEMFS